jgi:hypothetical protein
MYERHLGLPKRERGEAPGEGLLSGRISFARDYDLPGDGQPHFQLMGFPLANGYLQRPQRGG